MTGADKKLNYPVYKAVKITETQNKKWNKNTPKLIRELLESKLTRLPELQVLKAFREDLGLSQSELSRKTGISTHTISRLEKGKCDPGYSKVKKIVAFLISLTTK